MPRITIRSRKILNRLYKETGDKFYLHFRKTSLDFDTMSKVGRDFDSIYGNIPLMRLQSTLKGVTVRYLDWINNMV